VLLEICYDEVKLCSDEVKSRKNKCLRIGTPIATVCVTAATLPNCRGGVNAKKVPVFCGQGAPRHDQYVGVGIMSQATLNIVVIPKRILTKVEAASHCGRPVKRFEVECPVQPIRFPNDDVRYDIHDLDKWLDSLKVGQEDFNMESIIQRLC
jgi:hypothetical protein